MYTWTINFTLEPNQREVGWTVTAPNSKQALIDAVRHLALKENELLHDVHIGRPRKVYAT